MITEAGGSSRGRSLLLTLVATMALGPFFNFALFTSSYSIAMEIGVDIASIGMLATVIFVCAAGFSVLAGRVSSTVSFRYQILINYCGVAAAFVVASFADTLGGLLIACIMAGAAQSFSNPTTNTIIGRFVGVTSWAGWIGIKQSGVQLGQFMAGLFVPAMVVLVGWRGSSIWLAVLIVLLAILAVISVPRGRPGPGGAQELNGDGFRAKGAVREGRVSGLVWGLALLTVMFGVGMQGTNVYMPFFAVDVLGYSVVEAGFAAAVAGAIGLLSRLYFSNLLSRHESLGPALLVWLSTGALLGAWVLYLSGVSSVPFLLWMAVMIHGATVMGTSVIVTIELMRDAPAGAVGRYTAIVAMSMYLGFTAGPLLMATVITATGRITSGWWVVIGAYGCASFLSMLLWRMLRRKGPRSSPGP